MERNPEIDRALAEGNLGEALSQAKQSARSHPQDAILRTLLFDLHCLSGNWDAASNQLTILSELETNSPVPVFPLVYEQLLAMEKKRETVFRGEAQPAVLGESPPWLEKSIRALAHNIEGNPEAASALQGEALAEAEAVPGIVDDEDFAWICDADSRFGPVLELYVQADYFWLPIQEIAKLEIKKPKSLRDCVWISAQMVLVNGGSMAAMMPARYPGTQEAEDDALRLCRTTERKEPVPGYVVARGGRVLTTDQADHPLLNIRSLELHHESREPDAS